MVEVGDEVDCKLSVQVCGEESNEVGSELIDNEVGGEVGGRAQWATRSATR